MIALSSMLPCCFPDRVNLHAVTAGFISLCGVIIEPTLFCVLDVDQNKHNYVIGLQGYQLSTRILTAAGLAGKVESGGVQYFRLRNKVF